MNDHIYQHSDDDYYYYNENGNKVPYDNNSGYFILRDQVCELNNIVIELQEKVQQLERDKYE